MIAYLLPFYSLRTHKFSINLDRLQHKLGVPPEQEELREVAARGGQAGETAGPALLKQKQTIERC